MLNAQILPIAIPLLVIFMGRAIAREQVILAWLAVACSVVCSSVRLLLANRRQQRISDNLLNIERALRSSEEILSTAFRNSPDAFSINPFPNGPYLEVNDGFTRLTGHSREETLGKTPRQMNLWVDSARRDEVLVALTRDRHIRDFEFRFRTKSGQIRIGQMGASVIPVRDQLCSLVVVRDITERKEAEDLLRASEERFRSLVENLHVGIIIYDPQVRVLFANQAVEEAFGNRYEQFLGKTTEELGLAILREDGTELLPPDRPVPRVLATKRPLRSQVIGVRTPSSSQVVWALLDAIPEFNAAGEISRVIVSITDLSEQRRAAEALRESEERFRTLVSDLHVAVVLSQPDGRIEFANAAAYRIFGVPEGTAIGKLPNDLGIIPLTEDGKEIPVDDRPIPWVVRTKAPVENGVLGIRLPGASGKFIWVFGNAAPQFDAHGNVMRVITAFSDITEMKNAERAIHSLSTRLLQLQDDERRRIGRELHDGLAQTVLAINLSLAQVRQSLSSQEEAAAVSLERARTLTQQMSREIRTLSYLLHPPLLDDLGLVSTLKEGIRPRFQRTEWH
jgi:PAS domain S-box-containing protein